MRRRFALSVTLLIIFISAALAQDSQVIFLCRHSRMCETQSQKGVSVCKCYRRSNGIICRPIANADQSAPSRNEVKSFASVPTLDAA
jgi:hypothetical protein